MERITMPEPVFVRAAPNQSVDQYSSEFKVEHLFNAAQMEAYAAAKVREALEEAARSVADPVLIEATIENFCWARAENHARAHQILTDAQQAIRALIK